MGQESVSIVPFEHTGEKGDGKREVEARSENIVHGETKHLERQRSVTQCGTHAMHMLHVTM